MGLVFTPLCRREFDAVVTITLIGPVTLGREWLWVVRQLSLLTLSLVWPTTVWWYFSFGLLFAGRYVRGFGS